MTDRGDYIPASNVLGISLAGGRGERLGPFTWYRTKPGIMAGPCNLSAFSTSNAFNSGIEKIIMAVQYLPFSLEYFYQQVHGADFGHRKKISILNPTHFPNLKEGFRGTADAFFYMLQKADDNLHNYPQEYVLGLSGDHIYRCDFTELFDTFRQNYGEDAFIVFTTEVSREEASDFGILTTEPGGTRVVSFEEKPSEDKLSPGQKTFKASAGIYFSSRQNWRKLMNKVQEMIPGLEEKDIGKHAIPYAVANPDKFQVHTFNLKNPWADVGKPRSYKDTVMATCLDRNPDIHGDPQWPIERIGTPIWSMQPGNRHLYCQEYSEIRSSRLDEVVCSPGTNISHSEARNSIFLGGSEDEKKRTHITNSILENVIADKGFNSGPKTTVRSEKGLVLIAKNTRIPSKTRIEVEGMAVVARTHEMVANSENLHKFIQKQKEDGEEVELFNPEGQKITIEEVLEIRKALLKQ